MKKEAGKLKVTWSGGEEEISINQSEGEVKVLVKDKELDMNVVKIGDHTYSAIVDGRVFEVQLDELGNGSYAVYIGDNVVEVKISPPKAFLTGEGRIQPKEGTVEVRSPMPGRIVHILAGEGESVKAGDPLLVLEAMKMENNIVSPRDGIVNKILVRKGQNVETGDLMVVVG
jgi:biotin carboxyl carrier protein